MMPGGFRMLKLRKFRVTNFRSVKDSGWVEVDDTTSLIGINESGKSNLLLPLWKLNPAKGGEIHPVSDYPRSMYNDIKHEEDKPTFIEAHFELHHSLAKQISEITDYSIEDVSLASVSKNFAGERFIGFPNAKPIRLLSMETLTSILNSALKEITTLNHTTKSEEVLKPKMLDLLSKTVSPLTMRKNQFNKDELTNLIATLTSLDLSEGGAKSTIVPRYGQLIDQLNEELVKISKPGPWKNEKARELVSANIPKFVYYSNYGNLDSEIYLPHVIQNLERQDLGAKEEAKARTLKVLFDFVGLKPKEILELGQEAPNLNEKQLKEIAEKKRERDVLLQSASTKLTKEFRDWWKQGDYRFRFSADGNFFRIWVSDDKRPDDIELEGRSTGLQWFLSFFLVFLVEADDSHEGAILLLDEPGLTLHPLAQKDLSAFFDNLSDSNQIIFSTHSPFLIESDKLNRVRAVYLDSNGNTTVTTDLRAASSASVKDKSIYAAHAALGLSVSDVIFQGCEPVIVEGPSDQLYLSALKTYLISKGLIAPNREILFVPGGGTRAIKSIASIVAAKDELPFVFLDSDNEGKQLFANLKCGLYSGSTEKLVQTSELLSFDVSEVEDLFPVQLIASEFSKICRGQEEDFEEVVKEGQPIVAQMENFAVENGVELSTGWKVELARRVKRKIEVNSTILDTDQNRLASLTKLFELFSGKISSLALATEISTEVQVQ